MHGSLRGRHILPSQALTWIRDQGRSLTVKMAGRQSIAQREGSKESWKTTILLSRTLQLRDFSPLSRSLTCKVWCYTFLRMARRRSGSLA